MKVYKIEFRYFDGSIFDYKYVEITALTKIQLMKAFLKETRWISRYSDKRIVAVKNLWNCCKINIEETTLTFPIISYL